LAARLAAGRVKSGQATAEERHAVAAALASGQRFGGRTPLSQLIDADVAFHAAIHTLSGNCAIQETVADQWPHFRRSMGLVLSVSGAHARYWDEHAAILEAILAGDATAAEERARQHTAAAGEATARQLETEETEKETRQGGRP
jgi:DNA-binding GntR family transcriptional regulator